MFQLQLCMAAWDRNGTDAVIQTVGEALMARDGLAGAEQPDTPLMHQIKLHFNALQVKAGPGPTWPWRAHRRRAWVKQARHNAAQAGGGAPAQRGASPERAVGVRRARACAARPALWAGRSCLTPGSRPAATLLTLPQIMYSIRLGHYDQLVRPADAADASAPPAAIVTLEELLAAVKADGGAAAAAAAYEWLPTAAQEGLVHLLAATVLRAPGKVKPALEHVAKGACGAGLSAWRARAARGGAVLC
jgi:hypothetical protein